MTALYDVRRNVQEARDRGLAPNLSNMDLSGMDLSGADLSGANLRGANLEGVNLADADLSVSVLRDAYLRCANLEGANLHYAQLRGTDLSYADLRGADLRHSYLRGADLSYAVLTGAALSGAILPGAQLQRVTGWDGLQITNLHRHAIQLDPTFKGWVIHIGSWTGNPDELETLIAQDKGWPGSAREQTTRNRPLLSAALALIRAHIVAKPDAIDAAIKAHEKWENKNREKK